MYSAGSVGSARCARATSDVSTTSKKDPAKEEDAPVTAAKDQPAALKLIESETSKTGSVSGGTVY